MKRIISFATYVAILAATLSITACKNTIQNDKSVDDVMSETDISKLFDVNGLTPIESNSSENINYELYDNGVLIISGEGDMPDYIEEPMHSKQTIKHAPWYDYRDRIKAVKIEESITSISSFAFYYNHMENISIANSVTKIGEGAFYQCEYLKNIKTPKTVSLIDKGAFINCSGLRTINIPNGVTEINNNTFYDCWRLETVNIPNSVKIIGLGAFSGCSVLKSINIPNGVTQIRQYAFSSCGLEEIKIPDSVVEIRDGAFRGCEFLKDIIIPKNVEKFGEDVFAGATNLTIHSSAGSPAEIYARENNINFAIK